MSEFLFKVGARVINLLGFNVLIDDSKNCPLKSSKSLFDKFSFNKFNNSSLLREVVIGSPWSSMTFLATSIISGVTFPVIGPFTHPF